MKEHKNISKRNDIPNKTFDELMNDGWDLVERKYEYMIRAILNMVRSELDRLYWNKNQEEMNSPFDNTGERFENEYITIRAYDWNENELPNFDTDVLKIWWYKHSNRGLEALVAPGMNINDALLNALNNTVQSLKETYAELSDD